jgi:hypothetical protein
MYSSISFIQKKAEDHRIKNISFINNGKENFSDTDLCKIVKKINKINDQLLSFQFTQNMISPITFTNPSISDLCP